jgi:hypothetical protein
VIGEVLTPCCWMLGEPGLQIQELVGTGNWIEIGVGCRRRRLGAGERADYKYRKSGDLEVKASP